MFQNMGSELQIFWLVKLLEQEFGVDEHIYFT